MSWTRTELKRSYPCNPELIKFLRERKKWSQKQLAKESGYCERLICKAEAGGSIASATIDVLAKTLSTPDMRIHPEDLISDPVALSRKFIEATHTLQRDVVKGIRHFSHPEGEFRFFECLKGQYDGNYQGLQQLDIAAEKFFDIHAFVPGQDFVASYRYFGMGNEVVVWGNSALQISSTGVLKDIEVTMRLHFEKGKLIRMDDRSQVATSLD
jgi:transcriptional regulator with XRE-family HTH domain